MTVTTGSTTTSRSGSSTRARPSTATGSEARTGLGYHASSTRPEAASVVCSPMAAALAMAGTNLQGGELGLELRAQLAAADRNRPAGQVDVEVLADVDEQLAAVEDDGHRRVAAAQHVGDRRTGRAGPARQRLPHPALEDPRADAVGAQRGEERDVGAGRREQLVALDRGADGRQVEALELVARGDVDRALRVADEDLLEAPALDLAVEAQPRAAHVDAAGALVEDGRADLAGGGLDRERLGVGPAVSAQVEDGLARAVARQLRLRAVRVEDAQAGDEAALVGGREHQHAVGAD